MSIGRLLVAVAVAGSFAGCKGADDKASGEAASGKPAMSSGAATTTPTAAAGPSAGKAYKTLGGSLVLDLPAGADVSDDGSVFGPGKLEFAVYLEDAKQAPKTDAAARKEIIKGRSEVKSFTSESTLPDGWVLLFAGERGLGFECGRALGGKRFVFWGDRLPDEATRTMALDACKTSHL